jgi:hypothetical protein
MSSRHWLTLVIAVCGALAVTGAEAAAKKKAKVAKGTYSLWDGKPWIPPRSGVDVWGKATGPGLCGGTAIQVSSWKPNKNLKCKA